MKQIVYDLVGMPWVLGGDGEAAFDCWSLCAHVWKKCYGIDVPIMQVNDSVRALYGKKFKQELAKLNKYDQWHKVDNLQNGDACLMAMHDKIICHIGVYFDFNGGGVLHAIKACGVQFSSFKQLENLGFSIKIVIRNENI